MFLNGWEDQVVSLALCRSIFQKKSRIIRWEKLLSPSAPPAFTQLRAKWHSSPLFMQHFSPKWHNILFSFYVWESLFEEAVILGKPHPQCLKSIKWALMNKLFWAVAFNRQISPTNTRCEVNTGGESSGGGTGFHLLCVLERNEDSLNLTVCSEICRLDTLIMIAFQILQLQQEKWQEIRKLNSWVHLLNKCN